MKTQKPPEMPPVIWAYMNPENDGGGFNVDETDGIPDSPWINGRYIIAEPKEDVESLLNGLDCADKPMSKLTGLEYRDLRDSLLLDWVENNIETIRRVLLANAGRKE